MVRIEEAMIDKELDDFYRDLNRFKGHKLLVNFKQSEIDLDQDNINDFKISKPKYKKKQKASTYIKPSRDKNSLF
jgi:hypothetical protein